MDTYGKEVKMVSSIGSSDDFSTQQLYATLFKKLGAADTDGTKGLSKTELSTIDFEGNVEGSAFLKSLNEQFEDLDTDKNGQLSADEISMVSSSDNFGPPPGLELESSEDSTSNNLDTIKKIKEASTEAFLGSYADSDDEASKVESLISSADADNSKGLTADELSAAQVKSGSGKSDFISDLAKNFGKYDANGDGELSKSELMAAMPKGQFSQQEQKAMIENNHKNSFLSDLGGSFEGASSLVQKLINSYKSGQLQQIASSLNIAI